MIEVQPVRDEDPIFTIRFSMPYEYGCIRDYYPGRCRSDGGTIPQSTLGSYSFWPNIAGVWQRIQDGTLPGPVIQINYTFTATSTYSSGTTLTLSNSFYLNTGSPDFYYHLGNFGGGTDVFQCPGNSFMSKVFAYHGTTGDWWGYCFGYTDVTCTNGETVNAMGTGKASL